MKFDLVVTRHKELITYLKELNLVDDNVEVIDHASSDKIKNKKVIGILPHSLSCVTELFGEIPLVIPIDMRGKQLTIDQIREFAKPLQVYKVEKIEI